MSSSSQMVASGRISFASDNAVKNAEDIALHLKFFNECIEKVQLDDGQVMYIYETSPMDGVLSKKIHIGLLEINLSINTDTFTATVQIYLDSGIIKPMLLAQAIGALKFNSDIEVDFAITPGNMVAGVVGIKVNATDDVILFWDYTSFGVETKDSYIIFHL